MRTPRLWKLAMVLGLSTVLLAGAAAPARAALPFFIQVPDGAGIVVSPYVSVALDQGNHPVIGYSDATNHRMKYARRQGSGWTAETVDQTATGYFYYPALRRDPQGVMRMVYSADLTGGVYELRQATRSSTGWTAQTVMSGTPQLWDMMADMDGLGRWHVVYYAGSGIQYIEQTASGFQPPVVAGPGGTNAFWPSVVVYNDQPRISYIVYSGGSFQIWYAWRDGTGWHQQFVLTLPNGVVVDGTSLAVTSTGDPRISYTQNQCLKMASKTGTGPWTTQMVPGTTARGRTTITVNPLDQPFIAYNEPGTDMLWLAYKTGATWTKEQVDFNVDFGSLASLMVDGQNNVVIGYKDDAASDIRLADCGVRIYEPNGGETYPQNYSNYLRWGGVGSVTIWMSEEDGLSWSYQGSMTGNGANNTSTSFRTPSFISARCRLKIERASPVATTVSAGRFRISPGSNRPWTYSVADDPGVVGQRPSIATDGTLTGISYHDSTNGDLKFVSRCLDGPWTPETVASTGTVGLYSSTRIVNGIVYLLFVDPAAGVLKLGTKQAESWSFEDVYTGSVTNPSLAVDAAGNPHVAFWTSNQILYGYKSGGWQFEVVGAAPLSGECSIALTSANSPRVAYFSAWWSGTNEPNPRYGIRLGPNNWTYETTEPSRATGYGISLAINAQDLARISYVDIYNSTSKRIRVARKITTGWSQTSVRTTSDDIGLFTSLALNSLDETFVSYWSHGMFQVFCPATQGSSFYSDLGSIPMGNRPAALTVNALGDPTIAAYDMPGGNLTAWSDTPDRAPPAPITDISAVFAVNRALITWSDTGDDGTVCTASYYELRRHTSPINSETAWADATLIDSGEAGTVGWHCFVADVTPCSTYWFAVRLRDNANQWSALGASPGGTAACEGYFTVACDWIYATHPDRTERDAALPTEVELAPVAPNPVRDEAAIRLAIPSSRIGQRVELALFDVMGRRVATLHRGALSAGWHTIRWDRRTTGGSLADRGVYYLRMSVGDQTRTRSLLVLGR